MNSQSVINIEEHDKLIGQAYLNYEDIEKHLLKLIEYRKQIAQRRLTTKVSQETEKYVQEIIKYCNTEIKKLLFL